MRRALRDPSVPGITASVRPPTKAGPQAPAVIHSLRFQRRNVPGSVLCAAEPAANKTQMQALASRRGEMSIEQISNYKLWCVQRRLIMNEPSEREEIGVGGGLTQEVTF